MSTKTQKNFSGPAIYPINCQGVEIDNEIKYAEDHKAIRLLHKGDAMLAKSNPEKGVKRCKACQKMFSKLNRKTSPVKTWKKQVGLMEEAIEAKNFLVGDGHWEELSIEDRENLEEAIRQGEEARQKLAERESK